MNAVVELQCFRSKDRNGNEPDGLSSSLISSSSNHHGGLYTPCAGVDQRDEESLSWPVSAAGDDDEIRQQHATTAGFLSGGGVVVRPPRSRRRCNTSCCRSWEKLLLHSLLVLVVICTATATYYYRAVHATLQMDQQKRMGYDVEIVPGRTTADESRVRTTLARLNHEVDTLCDTARYASCYIQSYQYTCNCRLGNDYDEQWTWKVTMPKPKPNNQLYRMTWYDGPNGTHHRMAWKKALAFKEAQQTR
jgi:hypothetical protein